MGLGPIPNPQLYVFFWIPVLNGDGYATLDLEPFSQEFIDYSSKIKYPVLDAGAAYGLTSITALRKGATVICN